MKWPRNDGRVYSGTMRDQLNQLRNAEAVKAAQRRETVREIGKENVAELMRKRGVDDPEDLE